MNEASGKLADFRSKFMTVGGGHWEDVTSGWPQSWQLEAPHPLPCPWKVCPTHHSYSGAIFKHAALRGKCVVRPSGQYTWLTQARPPCKLLRFWRQVRRLTHPVGAKDKPCSKFPCLLKLLPINREWSASSFGLSLSSMYKGQFANQHCVSPCPTFCCNLWWFVHSFWWLLSPHEASTLCPLSLSSQGQSYHLKWIHP